MIRAFLLTLCFLAARPAHAGTDTAVDDEPYRVLPVGGEELLDLDFEPETNHLESSVLEVRPGTRPSQLRLVGRSPGKGSFQVHNKQGELLRKVKYHVIKIEPWQRFLSVKRLLKGVAGITVRYEGEHIVVDGKPSAADANRIRNVRKAYPELLDLATGDAAE